MACGLLAFWATLGKVESCRRQTELSVFSFLSGIYEMASEVQFWSSLGLLGTRKIVIYWRVPSEGQPGKSWACSIQRLTEKAVFVQSEEKVQGLNNFKIFLLALF